MIKQLTLLLTFSFLAHISFSQGYTVKGVIKNAEGGAPIPTVTVTLQSKSDSTLLLKQITDSLGRFVFEGVRSDTFNLSTSAINFAAILRQVVVDSANVDLAMLEANRVSQVLAGVTVTASAAPATQKGDTLQLNANQFKVNPDATVEDLARKMPGITIENGVVKAQGENVQRVTLDGRELFGDDATAALRNLPAEIVDKIQVFDRLSDQAQFSGVDDGNTTKGLNIVTKANMRNGQFGRVYAGAGSDGRYQAGGNTTLLKENRKISIVGNFNNINQQNFGAQDLLGITSSGGGGGGGGRGGGGRPGGGGGGGGFQGGGNSGNFLVNQQNGINRTNAAGINYTDNWGKKMIVTGSYFFNNTNNNTDQQINRQYFLEGIPAYNQSTISNSRNTNHRVNMRFEYRIDSSNQLIITPGISIQDNQNLRRVSTGFYNPSTGAVTNRTDNTNSSDRMATNLNNSILYRHSFRKRGRTFSVNLNTSSNVREGEVYTSLFDTLFIGTTFKDTTSRRFTDQSNDGYNVSANLVYTEPVSKNAQIQLSYNPSYSKSKADQAAYQYEAQSNKYSIFDPLLSSKFNNLNTANNAGFTYRYGTRDNQFNVGVNYQRTNLNSDQDFPRPLVVKKSFDNFLPNAMLRLKLNSKSNVRLFYRANTNQPSVNQLQDVYDVTNLPFVTAGNPELEQQVSHVLGSRYTYTNPTKGTLLSGNIFLQQANNYITNATFVPLRDSFLTKDLTLRAGQQLTKPVNLDGYVSIRSFLTFAMPLKFIKSNINMNGGVNYSKLPGIINNRSNISKNITYTLGSVLASNVSQYVDFTVSYAANFNKVKNQVQPQLDNSYFSQVASLQLNLLSKKGWFFQNDLNNQLYSGLTAGFNQSYFLWNMSAGRKFLKNQKGELKLSVFDLLKQNRSINRNVTETYIEDVQNQVLQQYFMLTFSYNLRNFGTVPQRNNNRGNWRDRAF